MAQHSDDPPNAGLQENCKKLTQLRVEKLRKEDEEEQWISGEELYTEGSSDEDLVDPRNRRRTTEGHDGKLLPRRRGHKSTSPRNHKKRLDPTTSSSGAFGGTSAKNSLFPEVRVSSQLSDSDTPLDRSVSPAVESEDEVVEISWRPKRGSIKLPELSTEGRLGYLMKSTSLPNYFETSLTQMVSTREAMDKIKEMDALLFMVEAKKKEYLAKTEQSELKMKEILKELCEESPSSRKSKFLARNARKFVKLCSTHVSVGDQKEPWKEVKVKRPSLSVQVKGTRKKLSSTRKERKGKNAKLKFLHRNVQLAADGKGTLAVTTEERDRLARLLRGKHPPPEEKFLRLDPGAAQLLNEIDSKLKEYAETEVNNGLIGDEAPENYALKLEEITHSLKRLNEATTEVLSPLGEGALRILLETCKPVEPRPPSSYPTPSSCSSSASVWPNIGTERNTPTEPPEVDRQPSPMVVIAGEQLDSFGDLVEEAKRLMPFFKFRY